MKKVICMLLALLMMLAVFAGCAKQSKTQTTDTPAQTDTQTPAETPPYFKMGDEYRIVRKQM